MRRLSFALAISIAILALLPVATFARGPEKNDSLSGSAYLVLGTENADIYVSAHTISGFTTAATGNMSIKITSVNPTTGDVTYVNIWADVYCLWVIGPTAQVKGNVYRSEPDLGPLSLTYEITDFSSFTTLPDTWDGITGTPSEPCTAPTGGVDPIAKGDFKVNDG